MDLSKTIVRSQFEILIERIYICVAIEKHYASSKTIVILGNDQSSTVVRIANHLADVKFSIKFFYEARLRVDDRYYVVVILFSITWETKCFYLVLYYDESEVTVLLELLRF